MRGPLVKPPFIAPNSGGGGGGAGSVYEHTQSVAAATWTVNHNLGFKPYVQVLSNGGAEVEVEVVHISVNQLQIYFINAFAGYARLI